MHQAWCVYPHAPGMVCSSTCTKHGVFMPVILATGRWRKEGRKFSFSRLHREFETRMGYMRPCIKNNDLLTKLSKCRSADYMPNIRLGDLPQNNNSLTCYNLQRARYFIKHFTYIKPNLHPYDEADLIRMFMVYDCLNAFLHLVCKYLARQSCAYVLSGKFVCFLVF